MNCKECDCELLEWEETFEICMSCDAEREEPIMVFKLK